MEYLIYICQVCFYILELLCCFVGIGIVGIIGYFVLFGIKEIFKSSKE